jgi:hypothetical protein
VSGAFWGIQALLIDKAALLADASTPVVLYAYMAPAADTDNTGFAPQPAVDADGRFEDIYLVGVKLLGDTSEFVVSRLSPAGLAPLSSFKTHECRMAPCADGKGNCTPQPGAPPGLKIDAGNWKVSGGAVVAGPAGAAAIYFARSCNQAPDVPTSVYVSKFDPGSGAAALVHTVSDPSLWLTYPSVAVAADGTVCTGFSASSATVSASTAMACVDPTSGAAGGVLTTYGGPFKYTVDYGSGRNRFGDYRCVLGGGAAGLCSAAARIRKAGAGMWMDPASGGAGLECRGWVWIPRGAAPFVRRVARAHLLPLSPVPAAPRWWTRPTLAGSAPFKSTCRPTTCGPWTSTATAPTVSSNLPGPSRWELTVCGPELSGHCLFMMCTVHV